MKHLFKSLIILGIFLTSCESTSMNEKSVSNKEETFVPKTPKDYIIDLIKNLNELGQFNDLKNDSINFDSCSVFRSFNYSSDSLIGIKYAVYSDSSYVLKHTNELINSIKSIIGDPKQVNLYSYKWIKDNYSIKLKVFPKEGFDLNISPSLLPKEKSTCVGDLYESISFLSKQLSDAKSIGTFNVAEESFDGIHVIVSENNIDLIYNCTTTPSLQQLDTKSIQNAISNQLSLKQTIKDGMSFWESDSITLSYSKLSNGHQITLIQ